MTRLDFIRQHPADLVRARARAMLAVAILDPTVDVREAFARYRKLMEAIR